MPDKQLNVWVPEELRNYVAQRAEQEKCGMNKIIVELIQRDMAVRNGEIVEQNSLVVMRELIAAELRQAHAQLRHDLREDREYEAESAREWFKKQVDRLAGLMVMAVRNGNIIRRVAFTHLSKDHGRDFAQRAYDNAKEKAQQELLPKKSSAEYLPVDDEEGS